MRIFRYLFREVGSSFLAVALVLLLIFISSRFVKYLAEAAAGNFSSDILLWIMVYRLPGFVEIILPVALFIGIMLACGRLYVDSEMIVLQACGISKTRLMLYVQGPALLVMLLVLTLTCWITPYGWQKFNALWDNPENFNGISTLIGGSFKRLGGNTVIYTGSVNNDSTELGDVFVLRHLGDQQGRVSITRAERATVISHSQQHRYIELHQGAEYSGVPGARDYSVSTFQRYGQLITTSEHSDITVDSIDAHATMVLLQATDPQQRAALQWRIAMPFMIPVIAIMALALSETSHRRGRYAKLLPGIVLYILYFALLVSARSEIEKGKLHEAGLWGVHLVFLAVALLLMYNGWWRTMLPRKQSKVAAA